MPCLPLCLWCNIGGIKAHFQEGKTTFSNSTTDLKGAVGPSAPLQPPNGFLENFQVSLFEPRLLVPECESVLGGHVVASVQFRSVVQSAQLFTTPWTPDFSFTNSPNLLKLMSVESVMPLYHLIPFSSCLQSFPASGSFPRSQFFVSGGQSIGVSASASVLPMNIQD